MEELYLTRAELHALWSLVEPCVFRPACTDKKCSDGTCQDAQAAIPVIRALIEQHEKRFGFTVDKCEYRR